MRERPSPIPLSDQTRKQSQRRVQRLTETTSGLLLSDQTRKQSQRRVQRLTVTTSGLSTLVYWSH